MKTFSDSIACAVQRQPSRRRCGTRVMSSRSLKVPGSDSSALTTRYVGLPVPFARKRASASASSSALTATELLHDRRNLIRGHGLAVAVVDGHHHRLAASAEALDCAQRDRAVLGCFPRAHAELVLEC